ncbi:hypothetical protein GDO86_003688 [Hymenochirus boettgeri]|uniref:C2H2-type domain-containing protein n=1 Tax=Hymenochirus boettgeri TaxID=247094 RepID=A0A8T2K606_9PIPI|nr:hypothetical protein GDO86_003688 [Hymenochirus boettgeri]
MADGKGESRAGQESSSTQLLSHSPPLPLCLAETLQALEDNLKDDDVSVLTSTKYCGRFCEVLLQHTEANSASENFNLCTEVYATALRSFANARPYLTTESEDVLLLLGRLVLSCFEILISMGDDLSCDLGSHLKKSVVDSHNVLVEFGNNNLQLLVDMVQNGGAWKNQVLVRILSQQPVQLEEVQKWISQEGSCFLQMRVKHLMKSNCIQQAMLLSKICAESSELSRDFFFRQSFITCLCTMLPNEEAFKEISTMDGKEVLDAICNLESEGQDNTAFILCTTYLTQQLQNEITSCSWELTLFWSKLQRRIDPSLNTFLERCRQFGVIAKTRQHLFFLIRVVHAEAGDAGVPVSVVLCIRALQIPSNEANATKTSVCKTIACLLPQDLEVKRACQLTEFLFEPTFDGLAVLEELFQQPDQKNDEESSVISNSLRCELLLALKSHWMFDPEFWDWKTLKRHCLKLLGKEVSDTEEENFSGSLINEPEDLNPILESYVDYSEKARASPEYVTNELETTKVKKPVGSSERYKRWLQYKFYCLICNREVIEARILHHSKMHLSDGVYTCPVCIKKFKKKDIFVPHVMDHMKMPMRHRPKKREVQEVKPDIDSVEDACDAMGYISFKTIQDKNLQDRDVYPCPGTACTRVFKQFKYLSIHLKAEHHNSDENARHYLDMKNLREKCAFCRRHFITGFHLKQHMRIHVGSQPFLCASIDCNSRFNTVNELLTHKQSHNDPQYKCELEGCSLVFGDLGLLYHHEAQHFRDASYICSFRGCKKFYYSSSEMQQHHSTHTMHLGEGPNNGKNEINEITCRQQSCRLPCCNDQAYSINNLEKLCSNHPVLPDTKLVPETRLPPDMGNSCCKQTEFSTSSPNPCHHLPTLSNCLCNSENLHCSCKSRNVTVSLQRIHPSQLPQNLAGLDAANTVDNKYECGTETTQNTTLSHVTKDSNCGPCLENASSVKKGSKACEFHKLTSENTLNELLTSLKHLNLKNSNACINYSAAQDPEVRPSSSSNSSVPKYPPSQKQEKLFSQYLAQLACKPYFCELKGCKCAFVTKDALLLHYVKKHHYTRERALKLQIFQNKFAPFVCHICQRAFTRRTLLRIHYKQKHHLSKEKVNCWRGRRKFENKIKSRMNFVKFQANETIRSTRERRSIIQEFNRDTYVDSLSDETDNSNEIGTSGNHPDGLKSKEGRGRRRVVAQGKLCYILNKYHKPFHCIHNACNSSFTTQKGLIRHYQLVHQYNKESLCLEKDKTKTEYDKCRRISTCKYKECRKSFICERALSKHYTEFHSPSENEDRDHDDLYTENGSKHQTDEEKFSDETESDESEICCDAEGCSAIFSDHRSYTRHILSRHQKYKLYEGKSKRRVALKQNEIQENYIQSRHSSHLVYNKKKRRVKNMLKKELVELKTKEEALEMCTENIAASQFPCMVRGCASVVKLESSIIRHYKLTHNLSAGYVTDHTTKLVYCVKNFTYRKKEHCLSSDDPSPEKHNFIPEHKIPKLHLHGDIHSFDHIGHLQGESRESDDEYEDTEWKPPQHCKWQNPLQSKRLSFRENSRNHQKTCVSPDKCLGGDNMEGFQPLLSNTTQSATSVPTLQTLRAILDKALTNCGDLALKQLHYQRPVVVLERSKFNSPLIDLFSNKKNDELCVGIS